MMGLFTFLVMLLYAMHIEAAVFMPEYFDDAGEETTATHKPYYIIVMLNEMNQPSKKFKRVGFRQPRDPKVEQFFPFCGEACIDLEGKCDIKRDDCVNDRTPCDECDKSKKKCVEKCLNIVNYH